MHGSHEIIDWVQV